MGNMMMMMKRVVVYMLNPRFVTQVLAAFQQGRKRWPMTAAAQLPTSSQQRI
jgi:hypothetical protein